MHALSLLYLSPFLTENMKMGSERKSAKTHALVGTQSKKCENFCESLGIEISQRLGYFPIFGKSKFPKIGNFQNNG
jgi:hypothetical protein